MSLFCDLYRSLSVRKQLYSGANSPYTQDYGSTHRADLHHSQCTLHTVLPPVGFNWADSLKQKAICNQLDFPHLTALTKLRFPAILLVVVKQQTDRTVGRLALIGLVSAGRRA